MKKSIISRGNSKCKDSEVGIILLSSRHSRKVTVARAEYMRGRRGKVSLDR